MDSLNSSMQISMESTLESVDIPGLVIIQQLQEQRYEKPVDDDRNNLIDKIMRLYLKHNITLECLSDWVKLFNTRLEDCEKLPPGKVQLMDLFRENGDLADIFFFVKCAKCRKSTKVKSDEKKGLKCFHCDEPLKTNETNFFVIIPISKQIVQSIERNWMDISKFDTSVDKHSKSYSDAHDGSILRNVLNHYKDSDVNILSLCLNVDGANKFKSNSLSVWPIQLTQNYLPPHIRFLPQNILLNGLYYYKSSDNVELSFHEYMLPLINELNGLKQDAISMNIDDVDYKFKPIVTHCAVDLPAKSKIQETKQFGGYNACTYCDIPGKLVKIEKSKAGPNKKSQNGARPTLNINKKPKKTSYTKATTVTASTSMEPEKKLKSFVRYVEGDCSYKLRDEVETLQKMLTAYNGKESVDGIKDVSCLVGFEHFNIVWSIGVEYMHCVLQGVQKRMLNLFLNSNNSDRDYYIVPAKRRALDRKILMIRPTMSIVRKPRSLSQRSNYKASEYRSMLLYYLPVCLPGFLPNVYVKHVRIFSAAIYILLQKTITSEEVDRAEQMLDLFVKQHQELFGEQNMVMVVHLLTHLAESVRRLGPLWSHSAFPFERNNGCLLKLANGTTDVLHQISSKYCLAKSLINKNEVMDEDANILLGKGFNVQEAASHVFDHSSVAIIDFGGKSLRAYYRIRLNNITYTSLLYARPRRSIDYFIQLKDGTIGTAKYYFWHNDEICVMLTQYQIIDTIHHIHTVLTTNRLIISPIDEIEKKFLFMKVGVNNYIVCRPNPYENE